MSTFVSRSLKNALLNTTEVRKKSISLCKTSKNLIKDESRHALCAKSITLRVLKMQSLLKMRNQPKKYRNDHELPESLQYLGLVSSQRANAIMDTKTNCENNSCEIKDESQFAKPRIYDCGYCNAKFFHVRVYMKHLRRHKDIIRCRGCNKHFDDVFMKRIHQARCLKLI